MTRGRRPADGACGDARARAARIRAAHDFEHTQLESMRLRALELATARRPRRSYVARLARLCGRVLGREPAPGRAPASDSPIPGSSDVAGAPAHRLP
ncbi:MAG TPA: hypothetical protein VFD90_01995 [Gaiellales bacterium]|jgi:hypothetical protein|nr:hypothetical protein [Gaiellales bacterium]